jgi:hypothetical protein
VNENSGSGYVGMQSPDGQWTWNGTDWVPRTSDQRGKQSLPTPIVMAMLAALVIVIFAIIAVIYADSSNGSSGRDVQNTYCQEYAQPGDPACR